MTTFLNDIKYAFRQSAKHPALTMVTLLTLAVAIGATTAICSAIETTILDPLPVENADRLMMAQSFNVKENRRASGLNPAAIAALRGEEEVFTQLAVHSQTHVKYRGREFIELIPGSKVSPNFFSLWGIQPILGRTFAVGEDKPDAEPVVILGYGFWRTYLGSDPNIVGKTIEFDSGFLETPYRLYSVIGVMPEHFVFPHSGVQFWLPMADPVVASAAGDRFGGRYFLRNYPVYFRLAEGVEPTHAQVILETIAARQAAADPTLGNNQDWTMRLYPVSTMFADEATRERLWTLFSVIGLVWLIACANVANLLMARAEARQQEMATRVALGAPRRRLILQMLTESLLLAGIGGLCGLVLTGWGIAALDAFLGGIRLKSLALNWPVFGTALVISALTGIAFGLVPAWWASKPKVFGTLKWSGISTTQSGGARWLVRGLILSEIALAVVLLATAGLMIRTVVNVLHVDVGYDPDNLVSLFVTPPMDKYLNDHEAHKAYIHRLGEHLTAVPGVESVGIRNSRGSQEYLRSPGAQPLKVTHAACGVEGEDPFTALGVSLIDGRLLNRSDLERDAVVVSNSLARAFWPGERAVGKQLGPSPDQDSPDRVFEVVGVVGDIRINDYEAKPPLTLYRPLDESLSAHSSPRFYLRTGLEPAALFPSIHEAITQAEPGIIRRYVRIVSEDIYDATQGRRHFMQFMALYAAVGLALAAIGLYGLMTFAVQRRTSEFGVRMALGAVDKDILKNVMKEGLILALWGLAGGLGFALLGTRFLQSQLYGVTAYDPVTFGGVVFVLLLAALVACLIPARRASKIDPMEALRYE